MTKLLKPGGLGCPFDSHLFRQGLFYFFAALFVTPRVFYTTVQAKVVATLLKICLFLLADALF